MVNCFMQPNFKKQCDILNFIFLAQAFHGKFQCSVEHAEIGPSMATLNSDLLHYTEHHPIKLQPDSLNP